MISDELKPALLGVIPSTLNTCDTNNMPNITNVSRVWFVDDHHVAIANHMLKKSIKNLLENPFAYIRTTDPTTFQTWELEVEYIGKQVSGKTFDDMKNQYEIMAMMAETKIPISVKAAEVFRVLATRICIEENIQEEIVNQSYHLLLDGLEKKFGWDRSVIWMTNDPSSVLQIAAIHGISEEDANTFPKRLAQLCLQKQKPLTVDHIRSQMHYAMTTLFQHQAKKEDGSRNQPSPLSQHYVAFLLQGFYENQNLILCAESRGIEPSFLLDDHMLDMFTRKLNQLFLQIAGSGDNEITSIIEQGLDHIFLEGSKRNKKVDTLLSPREIQVAIQVARGLSNAEIAQMLFLSKRTVTTHLERIFQKLNIKSRTALASYVRENGLD
jgi:DNA-binding CsgD family transcriptional regulator